MQNLKYLLPAAILFLLIISGCTFTSSRTNSPSDINDAEKVTNKFFDLIKRKSYDSIYPMFSKRFYDATPKAKLTEILTATQNKLGDLQTTSVETSESKVVSGITNLGQYFLVYANHHAKFDSKESVTLEKEENGKIQIVGYNINSEGFFK